MYRPCSRCERGQPAQKATRDASRPRTYHLQHETPSTPRVCLNSIHRHLSNKVYSIRPQLRPETRLRSLRAPTPSPVTSPPAALITISPPPTHAHPPAVGSSSHRPLALTRPLPQTTVIYPTPPQDVCIWLARRAKQRATRRGSTTDGPRGTAGTTRHDTTRHGRQIAAGAPQAAMRSSPRAAAQQLSF